MAVRRRRKTWPSRASPAIRPKGSDLSSIDPQTGELALLYHPRRDQWSAHFDVRDAIIVPKTAVARVTVRLLQFNALDRLTEREGFMLAGALKMPGH